MGILLTPNWPTQQAFPSSLSSPLAVSALDGHSLGNLTHRSGPLSMTVSGNHLETISFFILKTPQVPLILGQPWLRLHIPHIDYSEGRILSWSTACHARCLRAAQTPSSLSQPPPTPPDLSSVPEVYHDLGEAFSKKQAGTLPPHRPYDCAIELRPGSKYPVSRLYNLAPPEKAAMDGYITECLAEGLIRPSRSPMAAGFFFVKKKDASLRPCIDYRGLNAITVRNTYPLPLMSSNFQPLLGATVFTKLDLWNAKVESPGASCTNVCVDFLLKLCVSKNPDPDV